MSKLNVEGDLSNILKDMGIEEQVEEEVVENKIEEAVAEEQPEAVVEEEEQHKEQIESVEDVDEELEAQAPSVEDEARAKGWTPNGPKSAEEFLRAEPLYKEIQERGKELKEMKSTIDALKAHLDKQKEAGYKQALEELKAEKEAAIRMGDVDEVGRLEKELRAKEASAPEVEAAPEANQFLEKHADWLQDPSYEAQLMREFVQQRDNEVAKYNLSPVEHIRVIESDLRKKFPSRFKSESKAPRDQAVETGVGKVVRPSGPTFKDLNPEQKLIAKQFANQGVMTVDEYINELKSLGEL